jgi:hypothetical protein
MSASIHTLSAMPVTCCNKPVWLQEMSNGQQASTFFACGGGQEAGAIAKQRHVLVVIITSKDVALQCFACLHNIEIVDDRTVCSACRSCSRAAYEVRLGWQR